MSALAARRAAIIASTGHTIPIQANDGTITPQTVQSRSTANTSGSFSGLRANSDGSVSMTRKRSKHEIFSSSRSDHHTQPREPVTPVDSTSIATPRKRGFSPSLPVEEVDDNTFADSSVDGEALYHEESRSNRAAAEDNDPSTVPSTPARYPMIHALSKSVKTLATWIILMLSLDMMLAEPKHPDLILIQQ